VIYVEINTGMNLKNVFLYDFILNVDMSLIFFVCYLEYDCEMWCVILRTHKLQVGPA
jgi:hypothetical protein